VSEISKALGVNDAGTVGQAAGAVTIEGRSVKFKKIIIYSPVLGVQGSGRVDFDGRLDFQAVAAPLANWKRQLQKSQIPLLDDIGAEVAGALQKGLDSATGKLLYQFKISGTAGKPVVNTERVPIITKDLARFLSQMFKGPEHLLDEAKR
jgi:hypothetical protein